MPAGITIVGLGPGGRQYWTQAAWRRLNEADEVYAPTTHQPGLTDLVAKIYDFDDLFKQNRNFDQVYAQIAAEIVRLGQREEGVVYATPGHPALDEPAVPRIRTLAEARQLPLMIIPGLSLVEAARTALGLNGCDPLQIIGAAELTRFHHPPLAPDYPALITQLCHKDLASKIKQILGNVYPDNFVVTVLTAAGSDFERLESCPLATLDDYPDFEAQTMLYLAADQTQSSFSAFQETIAHLRAPEGCPWDRQQTHQSLRPFLLEEVYEVLEVLDAVDPGALAEELGDLLLQIALHTQIATEMGTFRMGQVIGHINRKLLRRHPHVFGDVVANSVAEVTSTWELIKKAEKLEKGQTMKNASALDGIPKALPALAQALAISKKAVQAGFEWANMAGVLDKLIEEVHEVAEATQPDHLETEIGDVLFCVVNLARWKNIDPESALRATNARFTRRFQTLEKLAAAQGKVLAEMSLDDMEILWGEAKKIVG